MDSEELCTRLLEVRRETGLSQSAFAQKLDFPFRTYQSWEGGERRISVDGIDAIYEHCGINPLWLLRGAGLKRGDGEATAIAVLRGLLDRWEGDSETKSTDVILDSFVRVLSLANKVGLSDELLDLAARRAR